MEVVYMPENGKKFISYEVDGNTITFNDRELSFRADKKERDYQVTIDVCMDYTGGLVVGTATGRSYVAQLVIPARKYEETETDGEDGETTATSEAVAFSMDNCTLKLWEMEA